MNEAHEQIADPGPISDHGNRASLCALNGAT
jgi:hypothetical protein